DLFGGHASVRGLVTWTPQETWSVSGRVTGINPAALRPDLPGSLSFDIGASGRGFDTKGDLSAAFSGVSGKLRGEPASGSGTVTRAGATWGFSSVRVALGGTSLALDGHVAERLDLRFAFAARDLSLLAPGSRGELKASGSMTRRSWPAPTAATSMPSASRSRPSTPRSTSTRARHSRNPTWTCGCASSPTGAASSTA